jgi:hypothetical protein
MLPDDRLRDLLQQAEDRARPEPDFMDTLFDGLLTRRRRRFLPLSGWALPRPAAYAVLVPLVVMVAVVGVLSLTSRGSPNQGVGGLTPSQGSDQLAFQLEDAESETFSFLAPAGWRTLDATSPDLPEVIQAVFSFHTMLRLNEDLFAFNEGAVAVDRTSNGVDGFLVIAAEQPAGDTTRDEAPNALTANLAATEAENMTGPTTGTVALGDVFSASGTYPTGHVMHRAFVYDDDGQSYEVVFLTKASELDQEDGARVFEEILNSIEERIAAEIVAAAGE